VTRYIFSKILNQGGGGAGGAEAAPMSPNDKWGREGSKIGQKKFHVLLEWPLIPERSVFCQEIAACLSFFHNKNNIRTF